MKKLSMLVAIVVIASWSVVNVQQPQEPAVSSQPTDKKTKYLLETYIVPQLGPSYFAVNGPKEKLNSMFVSRFLRTDAQPESGRTPIRGVKLEPLFNGETAELRVSVLRGNEGYEEEELVCYSFVKWINLSPFLPRHP